MTRPQEHLGAIDIGASGIKYAHVDTLSEIVGEVERVETPYPCTPERLLSTIAAWIATSDCVFVAVGFPGDMSGGVVLEPGNLSRREGILSPIDPAIHTAWEGFSLEAALQSRCTVPVRVVNDATLAAYGLCGGQGRELVFTLGTGLGIALVVDGEVEKIRDIGAEDFQGLGTYDEVFGEPARFRDESKWRERFLIATAQFVAEFSATSMHVGGGNARHWRREDFADLGIPVILHGNEGTLRAAAKLYERWRGSGQ